MFIEVAFVNQPSKNPKFGSIKSADGIYYSIGADVLHRYKKGMAFDAPVTSREWQGKVFYSIPDSFDPTGGNMASPAAQSGAASSALNDGINMPRSSRPASSSHDQAGHIFVTGIVGRAMGSGKFDTQDIKLLTLAAIEAWNEIKGKL